MNFKKIKPSCFKNPNFFKNELWFRIISNFLFYKIEKKIKIYLGYGRKIPRKFFSLIKNLKQMMPHCVPISNSYKESENLIKKVKSNRALIFWFESKKKNSMGMKIISFPKGPTIFLSVENFYSFMNINFLGNASKWSRPILTFDENFNRKPHLRIFRFIFSKVFLNKSKKKQSEAFFDHVIAFFEVNSEIHFRTYQLKQIVQMFNKANKKNPFHLIEIGPRITFSFIRIWSSGFQKDLIFDSSFT